MTIIDWLLQECIEQSCYDNIRAVNDFKTFNKINDQWIVNFSLKRKKEKENSFALIIFWQISKRDTVRPIYLFIYLLAQIKIHKNSNHNNCEMVLNGQKGSMRHLQMPTVKPTRKARLHVQEICLHTIKRQELHEWMFFILSLEQTSVTVDGPWRKIWSLFIDDISSWAEDSFTLLFLVLRFQSKFNDRNL